MKKKIFPLILLCLVMIFTLASCKNDEDDLPTEKTASIGLEYKLNSDEKSYSVISIGTCTDEKIIIPSIYEGLPVTIIGYEAFASCENITSITIPESIVSIEHGAFSNCTVLTEINYNAIECDDVNFDSYVFSNTGENGEGIKVTIGANVKKIPAYLFCTYQYSPKITEIVFAEGSVCESIGVCAFQNAAIEKILIPNSVTSIGSLAFVYCSNLESVTIGTGLTSIGRRVFMDCNELAEIKYYATNCDDLPSGNYVFSDAGENEDEVKVTIGANVKKIPAWLFESSRITSVVFEDGASCETISKCAFYSCTKLESIKIPSNVKYVGDCAFGNCINIEKIEVDHDNRVYHSEGNCLIETDTRKLIAGCKNSMIPDYIISIGDWAFYSCRALESITIPNSVTSIGEYAFYRCSGLSHAIIGNGVTTIGNYSFVDCIILTTINYAGTEEHWNAISKDLGWDYNTGNYTIYYNCSD